MPAYAIDDQTAIKVVDGTVEVVSEGHWKLFTPSPESRLIGSGDMRARLGQRSGMLHDGRSVDAGDGTTGVHARLLG